MKFKRGDLLVCQYGGEHTGLITKVQRGSVWYFLFASKGTPVFPGPRTERSSIAAIEDEIKSGWYIHVSVSKS